MTSKSILITGGSGLLGRFVTQGAMALSDVRVLDLIPPVQDVPFYEADIRDAAAVRAAMEGIDTVIHLAAYDDGNAPAERDYMTTNLVGAWTVFEAAVEAGVNRVVSASSTAAVGLGADMPPDRLPVDERHRLKPRRGYDLSKEAIEGLLRGFVRRGAFSGVSLRPTLIVRPEKVRQILTELAIRRAENGPIEGEDPGVSGEGPRYGGLPAFRAWVSSRDCAAAFVAAATSDTPGYSAAFVAADDTLGGVPLLPHVSRVIGYVPEVWDKARFDQTPTASPIDNRMAKQLFGWAPRDRWLDMVRLVQSNAETFEAWVEAD